MTGSNGDADAMLDIRRISDDYAVSPQISPTDIPVIVEAGFTTLICNRPDDEVGTELSAARMREAADAAGLRFVEIPVTHAGLDQAVVDDQHSAIEASEGPVLAYCASGTRSTIVWALTRAGEDDPARIIAAAAAAGYDVSGLCSRLP